MSDERLRSFERRWRQTGSVEDEAAYLHERLRRGDLHEEVVHWRLARWRDPAAALALGRRGEGAHATPGADGEHALQLRRAGTWWVELDDDLVASLHDGCLVDMFWFSYAVVVHAMEPAVAESLADVETWASGRIRFRSAAAPEITRTAFAAAAPLEGGRVVLRGLAPAGQPTRWRGQLASWLRRVAATVSARAGRRGVNR